MNKPIIGIVARHYKKNSVRPNCYIRDEVKDAIFQNGGLAIGIVAPTTEIRPIYHDSGKTALSDIDKFISREEKEDFIAQIKMCDGLILQGGAVGDLYEVFVAKYAYDNDIPILGICAGQSSLVFAAGGTVLQLDNDRHDRGDEKYVHDITIEKNTKFYDIIGKTKMRVNSRHHNAVDDPKDLIVSARDHEGNIEVVEAADKTFYLGMRFHPESLTKEDKLHNNIFKAFLKAARG